MTLQKVQADGFLLWVPEGMPNAAFTSRRSGCSPAPFDSLNVSHGKGDGADNVRANRRAISHALGISDQWVSARQVHGAGVMAAKDLSASPEPGPEADAIVGGRAGLPLAVLTADCLPIALTGPGFRAVVHAGWRGLCAGVIDESLSAAQVEPSTLRASIGPSIGSCHYVVGDEVIRAFRGRYPRAAGVTFSEHGKTHFDLRAAARWVLRRSGVAVDDFDPPCTFCDPDLFSYRRDGRTGRQAVLVW